MQKAQILSIDYEPSDSIEMQGKREKIEKYLKKGYYVKESRNGYWVLVRTARVIVTVSNTYGKKVLDLKGDILDYYGKSRISQATIQKFSNDINSGVISILVDAQGCYSLE